MQFSELVLQNDFSKGRVRGRCINYPLLVLGLRSQSVAGEKTIAHNDTLPQETPVLFCFCVIVFVFAFGFVVLST